ncbi:MAG: hypothetical protein IPO17_16240 [Flavobacteriales bacterium]|nr:hypothetical protein [Flavobacteriales bacterium]
MDRTKVKIARFDYFGHANDDSLFLKYAWDNAKGDANGARGEVVMTAADFNTALAGKNAIAKDGHATLWGCRLGNHFGKNLNSFPSTESTTDNTTYEDLLKATTEMPKPTGGGTWHIVFSPDFV